jgi:hypothetical protein
MLVFVVMDSGHESCIQVMLQPLPLLPSLLPASPGLQDVTTTKEGLNPGLATVTNPEETRIYICALPDCNRLFPTRDKVLAHRKRDHGGVEYAENTIITWNE